MLALIAEPSGRRLEARRSAWCLVIAILGIYCTGCVQSTYRFGASRLSQSLASTGELKVQYGGPNPQLDQWEDALRYPFRKWNDWFGEGDVVAEARRDFNRMRANQSALAYIDANGLYDVYVDIRVHQPSEQWRRLKANDRIHPLWKYTDGALRVGLSSLIPRRVLGIDGYNPYTNTLFVNSAKPSSAVFKAAAAKDDFSSSMPGVLAVSRYLPIVPAWQESRIATDSLTYARIQQDYGLERELYPTAYANIGGSVLSEAYSLTSSAGAAPFYVGPLVSIAGRITGRGIGNFVANQVYPQ